MKEYVRKAWKWLVLTGLIFGPLLKCADLVTGSHLVEIPKDVPHNAIDMGLNMLSLGGGCVFCIFGMVFIVGMAGWMFDGWFFNTVVSGIEALIAYGALQPPRRSILFAVFVGWLAIKRWIQKSLENLFEDRATCFKYCFLGPLAVETTVGLYIALKAGLLNRLWIFRPIVAFDILNWGWVLWGAVTYGLLLFYFFGYIAEQNPFDDKSRSS